MSSRKYKTWAAVLLLLALIGAATGTVYAYLSATTNSVENTFTTAPAHTIDIRETFPKGQANPVKENVRVDVGNPGYAVYVRVAIVATWQKTVDGKTVIHRQKPVGGAEGATDIDYMLDWNQTDWFLGSDGFYYLKSMVVSGETPKLINRCYQCNVAPEDDYSLHIEIIAQTIQAKGGTDLDDTPAVEAAWGVKVKDDGTLDVS